MTKTKYAITLMPCVKCSHPTAVITVSSEGTATAKCFACGNPAALRKERKAA